MRTRALRRLGLARHQGYEDPRVRIACVGQPWPRTMADVQSLAQYYGVADRVDFYDSVDQAELNRLYSRSRAALLWSRKEGSNKSVIEAMLADIPVIIRHGHNYGTHYEFVNPETGVFAREEELPGLLDALHEGTFGPFAPRRWALEHWSPQRATCTVEEAIYGDCAGRLAEKVNSPDLQYRSPDAARALKPEYDVLMRYLV